MDLVIVPEEVLARISELQTLADDSRMQAAFDRYQAAVLALSKGSNRENCLEMVDSMKIIIEMVDALIERSIVLLSDTETYFVQVDNQLAIELER
jgi:hypothetical protein